MPAHLLNSGVVIGTPTTHETSIQTFALKRLIRIVPLYWLATAVALCWAYRFNSSQSLEHIIRSVFLWPDLHSNWLPAYFPAWTLIFA
jgi:exopolysaccharide production protein ExoZ